MIIQIYDYCKFRSTLCFIHKVKNQLFQKITIMHEKACTKNILNRKELKYKYKKIIVNIKVTIKFKSDVTETFFGLLYKYSR